MSMLKSAAGIEEAESDGSERAGVSYLQQTANERASVNNVVYGEYGSVRMVRTNTQDTHGYTDFAMALAALLGFELCPRLSHLKDRRLHVPNNIIVPSSLSGVVRRDVDSLRIDPQWHNLVHLTASVHSGHASAVSVLNRFGDHARGDPLYQAGRSLGQLHRSVFLCSYLSNPAYRREIHRALALGESYHILQRALYRGSITAVCGVRYTNAYSECPVCVPARRTLMTGMSPKSHGDRVFNDQLNFPQVKTLAQTFRDAGYQADAVGKLHVHPQRDRIGFDSVLLDDEGRPQLGTLDDYDKYLGDQGLAGRQFDHGMSNNQYHWRPWHLDEQHHATAWAGRMMARTIKRRDPSKPAFWYLGFRHPHPPLVPPQSYIDLYRNEEIDEPYVGDWANAELPFPIQALQARTNLYTDAQLMEAKRAFYALCSQIDHQIRYLIGTLRLEGLLDDTIILFTSDHGDMLGNHKMVAKRIFYESSANIPMILMPNKGNPRVAEGTLDDRLVGFADIMPTLLDLCDIKTPDTVDGQSMLGEQRDYIYGECGEDDHATRMIRDNQYKLIWYPVGNHFQLFDLENDPLELTDLALKKEHEDTLNRLQSLLLNELYGVDLEWVEGKTFVGKPDRPYNWAPHLSLNSQRGDGWPPSPKVDIPQIEWTQERREH